MLVITPKLPGAFDVGGNGIGKVGVVPQVEGVRGVVQRLALCDVESFDERTIFSSVGLPDGTWIFVAMLSLMAI